MFFLVNLALGGGSPQAQERAVLYVDYVRVYVSAAAARTPRYPNAAGSRSRDRTASHHERRGGSQVQLAAH